MAENFEIFSQPSIRTDIFQRKISLGALDKNKNFIQTTLH